MNITSIKEFQDLCRNAKAQNSREIRLTLQQAENLNMSLCQILLEIVDLQNDLLNNQKKLIASLENPQINWNGGKFY